MTTDPADARLCPSARCEPGSIVLGVVTPDGRVGYLRPEVRVDEEFAAAARAGRAPEKRFRFALPPRARAGRSRAAAFARAAAGSPSAARERAEPARSW